MKPIIFKEQGFFYLYSYFRKKIIIIDELLYNYIEEFFKTGKVAKSGYPKYVKSKFLFLKKNKFLDEYNVDVGASISIEDIKQFELNLSNITFELTEKCNLKCKYCIYGEMYNVKHQSKQKDLRFEIAKSTLDYFIKDLNLNEMPSIKKRISLSFYGGEPLLCFGTLKKIVEYSKRIKRDNIEFVYGITTNGLLLDRYIDYLAEHNFNILLSLDGDRNGSSYRVTETNKESFNRVFKNTKFIQQKHPDFFINHVAFNSVLHDRNPFEELLPFMDKEFNKIPMCSPVSRSFLKEKEKNGDMFSNINFDNIAVLHNSPEAIIKLNPEIRSISKFFDKYNILKFNSYKELTQNYDGKSYIPSGTCLPFSNKLFISADGKLYPCERIGYSFTFGYINDENRVVIDYNDILKQYNLFHDSIRSKCSSCYSVFSCPVCLFLTNFKCNSVDRNSEINNITSILKKINKYKHVLKKISR